MAEDGSRSAGEAAGSCNCKISRVSEGYELGDLSGELRVLWTDDGENRYSLRDLSDYFNRQVLRGAMLDAGMDPLDGEVENIYHLLTGEDANAGSRVQAERRLEREGLSTEELQGDFVTHQTVYRHLKNCLEAEYEPDADPATRLERDVDRIEAFQNRISVIVGEMARRLRDADLFSIESPSAYVDVRILCEECGAQYTPRDLIREDGCECETRD